jgi:YHS domain-containing protein
MYRIIFILALFTLLYFLLRSAIRELRERRNAGSQSANQISDKNQMIQDPNCRVFVPKGVAVREEIGGQIYFFCSRECAKTFQKQLAG